MAQGKGLVLDADILKLIFQALPIANIADNAGSGPLANLFVGLHTASPAAGDQTTNEAAYTSYARVSVARTTGGWDITGQTITPHANITFPQATGVGDNEVETHWSVGVAASGASKLLYYGTITPNITVVKNVTPQLTTASTVTES